MPIHMPVCMRICMSAELWLEARYPPTLLLTSSSLLVMDVSE